MKKRSLTIAIGSAMLVGFLLLLVVYRGIAACTVPSVGDANGDGAVNIADVTTIERMILGLSPVKSWADSNWDGDVNVGDIIYLERVIFGLSPQVKP